MKKALIPLLLACCLAVSAQLPQKGESVDIGLKPLKTAQNASKTYKLTKGKIIGLACVGVGSFIWYAKERWEFQGRRYFEVKHGVDPNGFWGSQSHLKPYTNPNFYNKNFGNWDFYHLANTGGKYLIIGGALTIGISGGKNNRKKMHYLYDFRLTGVVSVVCSRLGDEVLKLR